MPESSWQIFASQLESLIESDADTFREMAQIMGMDPLQDFSHVDLSGLDLSQEDLPGGIFRGTNFRETNLKGSSLADAVLERANLEKANLEGVNLRGAILRGANLRDAVLENANLREADLRGSNLVNANLRNANLAGADIRNSDLANADFYNARLESAKYEGEITPGQSHRSFFEFPIHRLIEYASGETLTIETGRIAKQANGSVVVRLGDTMVLSTATISDSVKEGKNFFPLTVDYREKFAAGGKVPGGFIKREGRPTDKETLTARLIDRAVRPLFPDGFYHSVHLVNFVISAGPEYDADTIAGVGSSAALMLSGAPFAGPVAEVRVGRVDGEFIVNPTMEQTEQSDIDLIVAGKEDALVMVEGEADEVSEEDMIDALDVAHASIRKLCIGQKELVQDFGEPEPFEWEQHVVPDALVQRMREKFGDRVAQHIRGPYNKESFYAGMDAIKDEAVEDVLGEEKETPEGYTAGEIREAISKVESAEMRQMILDEGRRLDGRNQTDVRDLWMEVGYLPRVHGSAIFTRGETQVLSSVTLGTSKDVQAVDEVFTEEDKSFYLHYRFPPFSVGEASFLRGPKRREIGHSMLAERALRPMIPDQDTFPYTIRINTDVMESNGSSSMASVCAGCLALMDAGVPVEKPVAGIAMGLVQEGDETRVLTDILGQEDHLGDMDFKVAGTRDGITACQMDMKIAGLGRDIMLKALNQARDARHHILDAMSDTLAEPRESLSKYAPRLTKLTIDPEHIGAVIGPGGKVVKSIQKETNTEITIDEEDGVGLVTIAAKNQEDAEAAIERVKQIVALPEEGKDYVGTVKTIRDFGAFVEIMPEKTGLLHVSEISHDYVENVEDYLQVGDKVKVHLLEVRDDGKMRLTRKPFISKDSNGEKK